MIVWSKGLGKLRLPLHLADATVKVEPQRMLLEGVIEPVCWNYAIKLSPADMRAFLAILSTPDTAKFLAEERGLLFPFILRGIAMLPSLTLVIIREKALAMFRRKEVA